jgi:hypothetical protein
MCLAIAAVPAERLEMKNSEIIERLLSNETASKAGEIADGLRLLKAFQKLTPLQRREVIELVERRLVR